MKTILALTIVGSLSSVALAQEALVASAPPSNTLGADAMAVMPVGDYAEVANAGIGLLGRVEVPAGTGFVTGRAGVVLHAIDSAFDGSLTLVPLYAGYRYPLGTSGAYLAGELGITVGIASVDTPFGTMSDSDAELGFTLMGGVRRGALDLRAGLFAPDADDALALVASAGFDFAAF